MVPVHTDEGNSVDTYVECSSAQYVRCYIKTQITAGSTPFIPWLFSVTVGKHHDGNQRQLDQVTDPHCGKPRQNLQARAEAETTEDHYVLAASLLILGCLSNLAQEHLLGRALSTLGQALLHQ